MIILITCLLGIGLYVFDLTTDVDFSLEMLKKGNQSSNDTEEFESFLPFPSLKTDFPECFADMNSAFNKKYDRTTDFDDFLSNNYHDFPSLKSDHPTCFTELNSVWKISCVMLLLWVGGMGGSVNGFKVPPHQALTRVSLSREKSRVEREISLSISKI